MLRNILYNFEIKTDLITKDLVMKTIKSNEQAKSFSKPMSIIAWVIALGLLTKIFGGYLDQRDNPNRSPISQQFKHKTQVTLKANRLHHYNATGFINGHKVSLMLDTGATDVVIPESLNKTLKLPKLGQGKANTANGTINIWYTQIDKLNIGDIKLYNVRASLNPHMSGKDILLGMSALKSLEANHRNGQLTLTQHH